MGILDDLKTWAHPYEDDIRAGSTMVRVGTAIFGARDYTR